MNKKNKDISKIVDWLVEGFENEQISPPQPPQPPPPPPTYDSVVMSDRLSPEIIFDTLQSLETNSPLSTFDSRSFESHRDVNPFDSRFLANPIPATHFQSQPLTFQSQPEASFYPSFVPSQSQSSSYIPQTTANNFGQFQIPKPTFQQNGSSFYDGQSIGLQSNDTGF
jgi:hypothetical protein